ncbi:putative RNA-directed DNA polymerase from transposon X-element [Trichonephila clavipes]|nr:putative RNA-directed DNA polymerase from transposon X-element [Trichonephila clavipes]
MLRLLDLQLYPQLPTQTDPNLSNIICPPLQCLTPISSKNPLPSTSSSVSTFSKSSSSTQDNLLPSPSVSPLETETHSPTTPVKLTSVSTENLSASVHNESNSEHSTAAEAQQFVKRKSRNRRKRPKPKLALVPLNLTITSHHPPSVRGMLYVDDLKISCQGSDLRLIQRQLQITVNRLVKWCDQNGHTISPSKSSGIHFCRKRNLHPDPFIHIGNIQIPVVSENLLSGAFRTSPVTSLYVVCHQPPLELRRRQLSANYFIRAMAVHSHPLKPFSLAIGLTRSFNIKPFSERAKAVLNDAHLNNINIQENNILAFPPWDIQIFNYRNPFSGYDKAGTAYVIYQQFFSYHRSKYSKYIPVYTDGSKTAGHVGCCF